MFFMISARMYRVNTMDDFEVIESSEASVENLQDHQNVMTTTEYSKTMCDIEAKEKMITVDPSVIIPPPMTLKAMDIISDVIKKKNAEYKCAFVESDTSNNIHEGREVIVTQRMIDRSYDLLVEVMSGVNITSTNITIAIVYACNISSREYLPTWQDKQALVLSILRKYIITNNEESTQPQTNMLIEAHVPIIVEKILCPRKKWIKFKMPKFRCCK